MTPATVGMIVLWVLALAVPVLLALGVAGALRPGWARHIFILVAGLGGVLLLGVLGIGVLGVAVELAVPIGPPGLGSRLRLDSLGCVLLLVLLVPAVAAAVAALEAPEEGGAAWFAPLLGLGVLALVARTPFLLVFALVALAGMLARVRAWPTPLAALALAGLPGVVLAGLLRHAPAEAVSSPWLGAGIMAAGAALGLAAGRLACRLDGLRAVPVALGCAHLALLASGIGLALLARAADLAPLAGLALTAVLLHALNHAVVAGLMLLAAGMLARAAGTGVLDRLGGLIQPMAVSGGCLLAGGVAAMMVPPSPMFASGWLLLQALFAAPRAGGIALGAVLGAVAAALAGTLALAAVAALRMVGTALLGRPRTPRVAAAQEVGKPARAALLGLVACAAVLGVLPGLATALIGPAARGFVGGGTATGDVLVLRPAAEAGAYVAPAVALGLVLALMGARWVLRRWAAVGHGWGAAWNDGFAAPPPWLPFGEPEAQPNATALARAVAPEFAPRWFLPRLGGAWIAAIAERTRTLLAGYGSADMARLGAAFVLVLVAALLMTLVAA